METQCSRYAAVKLAQGPMPLAAIFEFDAWAMPDSEARRAGLASDAENQYRGPIKWRTVKRCGRMGDSIIHVFDLRSRIQVQTPDLRNDRLSGVKLRRESDDIDFRGIGLDDPQ